MTLTPLFEGLDVPLVGSTFGHDTARVRKESPLTSHAAADSNDIHGSRAIVLAAFHERRFFADHQLVEFLAGTNYTPQRIRTARSELADDGLVVLAAHTTTTPTGRAARVWCLRKDAA